MEGSLAPTFPLFFFLMHITRITAKIVISTSMEHDTETAMMRTFCDFGSIVDGPDNFLTSNVSERTGAQVVPWTVNSSLKLRNYRVHPRLSQSHRKFSS
jgi:hypothetical protein